VSFPAFQKEKQCISLQSHLKKFLQPVPDKGQKRGGEKVSGLAQEQARLTPVGGGQKGEEATHQLPLPHLPEVKEAARVVNLTNFFRENRNFGTFVIFQ
jgi:hypothetical protein